MNKIHTSSNRHDYRTPEAFLERVRRVGPIGLDPCTSTRNPTGARVYVAPPADGLRARWHALLDPGELAFVNPPYGRQLPAWARKCAVEAVAGAEVVLLSPARTDTRWFPWGADALLFWRGRITFLEPDTGLPVQFLDKKTGKLRDAPAGFPSLVAYWGNRDAEFRDAFGDAGVIA